MPLSRDPEARARQLANLTKGGHAAAQRHNLPAGHGAQGDPATAPANLAHETAGGRDELPVIGYDTEHDSAPVIAAPVVSPEPAFAEPANGPKRETPDPEPEPDDELEDLERYAHREDRGGLGGLVNGFLGR